MYLYKKKDKSLIFLCFFAVFYIYLVNVIKYTQFPLLLSSAYIPEHYIPDYINLISFNHFGLQIMILNIIMTTPFGFGLPFIKTVNWKKVITGVFLLSLILELTQLTFHFLLPFHDRLVDVNDIIANVLGGIIGFLLFKGFIKFYSNILLKDKLEANPILTYIHQVALNHKN